MRNLLNLVVGFFLFTSMADPLDNLSLVSSHSSNLVIDTINPANFNNDSARAVRINTQPGFLIYTFENPYDFNIDFWAVDNQTGIVKVFSSEDGNSFSEIETISNIKDFGYRNLESIQPKEELTKAINFLKIEISGGNGAWKGQIGSVSIFERKEQRDSSKVFYVDSETGSDSNSGLTLQDAWRSLEKVNQQELIPGDSLLLKSGSVFYGSLNPLGSGSNQNPIVIGKYGGSKLPIINSAGYLAGVSIEDQSNIEVSDLEITSDAGDPFESKARTKRYGVNVLASQNGEYANLVFRNLNIHHIFATENIDSDGQNPTSNLGMGINIQMQTKDTRIKNVTIENCNISMTGHTGIKIFGAGDQSGTSYLDSVFVLDNHLENIGGPGMVPGRCSNVIVRGNVVNYSGSKADPRMHNRGSGIWPWTSKNVLIEKNKFMHAWGKYDSCGAHIDFNCSNVVVQYNLSYHNAGGFVEILGNDVDCVYRYNISINDGYRKNGVNGALSDGHIFWFSAYVGKDNDPIGANNCKVYNNTIYVASEIETGIRFEYDTKNNTIENNILYIDGELKYENGGTDNTFNNNIWYGNIPDLAFGNGAVFADPQLVNPGDTVPEAYRLLENSLAVNTGSNIGVVEFDFWGDSIATRLPRDRGADESAFSPKLIAIQSTAEEGGRIYPSGEFMAPENSDLPVNITMKPGYSIEDVTIDGQSVDKDSVYRFENISESHTIHAEFFAPADSVTDPLKDFTIVSAYVNMRIQSENPGNFNGDSSRAQRVNIDPGNIIYNFKEIGEVEVEFWTFINDNSKLKIYISGDGINYTEMIKEAVRVSRFGNRTKTVYSTMQPIPENIDFIKLEVTEGESNWQAQIGSVNLFWWGDEGNISSSNLWQKNDFVIYPNPVSDRLYLSKSAGFIKFEIYNLTGRKVLSGETTNEIDVSELRSGVYVLKINGLAEIQFVKL